MERAASVVYVLFLVFVVTSALPPYNPSEEQGAKPSIQTLGHHTNSVSTSSTEESSISKTERLHQILDQSIPSLVTSRIPKDSIDGKEMSRDLLEKGTDKGLYNEKMIEGDIRPSPLVDTARNAINDALLLWPHGTVVYSIDDSVGCPDSWRCAMLMDAMEYYHQQGCVRFKEWSGEKHRVHIFLNQERGSCWSSVGRTGETSQQLSLGADCWYRGIVLHELFHAIGFWHEMNRPDRDSWINIYWNNIIPGFTSAFYKQDASQVDVLGERFDYRSVMMYDEYAFSKDGISTTLHATDPNLTIGPIWKKNELSESDLRRYHRLYTCDGNKASQGFPYDIHCDFDENMCGFKNGRGEALWHWRRPASSDGFVYTSWSTAGTTPGYLQSVNWHSLDSSKISNKGAIGCAQFWYFMDTDSSNSVLTLMHAYLDSATQVNFKSETSFELWSSDRQEEEGGVLTTSYWTHVQVPLYITRPFKLLFISSFGETSTKGTIAIDDVEIFYSPCFDPSTKTAATKKINRIFEWNN